MTIKYNHIALSGSAGTGKTTLTELLAKKLGYSVVGEGVREYLAENFKGKDLRSMTPEESFTMQLYLLENKVNVWEKEKQFVADRCTADNMAYCLRWVGREKDQQQKVFDYIQKCKHNLKNYDIIFIAPYNRIPLIEDNLRSTIPIYQLEIQYLIEGILKTEFFGRLEYIESTDIDSSVEEILYKLTK